jgi:hypothetical protein
VAEVVGILRLAGLVTLQDLRLALLLTWKQLGLMSDVRAILEQKLVNHKPQTQNPKTQNPKTQNPKPKI